MNIQSSLIPIRVDVSNDEKTLRLVETMLFDPTCWPIPLTAPLSICVEDNVQLLANMILSDCETNGMGRTVRHFTGRLELWTESLQAKLEDQLRQQLWRVVDGHVPKATTTRAISIRLVLHGITIEEDFLWDPQVPLSALEFSEDMVNELKLPDEAVVSIATVILEQIHGLVMDTSVDRSMTTPPRKGAWLMETKDYISTIAHIVGQHRPKTN